MNFLPITESNGTQFDIFSLLLKNRIIFVNGPINDAVSGVVIAQLLYLDAQSAKDEICIYINSPGGSVTAGLAIYDTIRHVKAPVHTIGMGIAASAASLILASGDRRSLLEHTKVMIHQPLVSGEFGGKETDIKIIADELTAVRHTIAGLLAKHCKKDAAQVEKDIENDRYMSAEQALEYGICDEIINGD